MPRLRSKKVYIRSRRPHHPVLRCDGGFMNFGYLLSRCCILADQFDSATKDECWILKHLGNGMYNIIFRGWYLQASSDGSTFCGPKLKDRDPYHNNDKWKIDYTRKGYVSIKSCYNKYLCADEVFV